MDLITLLLLARYERVSVPILWDMLSFPCRYVDVFPFLSKSTSLHARISLSVLSLLLSHSISLYTPLHLLFRPLSLVYSLFSLSLHVFLTSILCLSSFVFSSVFSLHAVSLTPRFLSNLMEINAK